MKNYLFGFAILTVIVVSCKKESTPDPTPETTPNAAVTGKWTIDSTITWKYSGLTTSTTTEISTPYHLEFSNNNLAYYTKTNPDDTTTYSFLNPSIILMDLDNDNKIDTVQLSVISTNKQINLTAKVKSDTSGGNTISTVMTRYLSK